MTVMQPRSAWVEPGYPVTGPPFDARPIKYIVVHYGGVNMSEERLRNTVRYFRDTQRDYVDNRGYSIGYQIGVDRFGDLWELRGFDFKNAANNSTWPGSPYYQDWPKSSTGQPRPNDVTVSIHVILPLSGEYLPDQLEGCRAAVALIRERIGRSVPVIPHSDVVQTSCPGDPMRAAIAAGLLEPVTPPPPPPPPPPPVPGVAVFDDVISYASCPTSQNPAIYALMRGGYKYWFKDGAAWNAHKALAKKQNKTFALVNYTSDEFRALGPVIGPKPDRTDGWGV